MRRAGGRTEVEGLGGRDAFVMVVVLCFFVEVRCERASEERGKIFLLITWLGGRGGGSKLASSAWWRKRGEGDRSHLLNGGGSFLTPEPTDSRVVEPRGCAGLVEESKD